MSVTEIESVMVSQRLCTNLQSIHSYNFNVFLFLQNMSDPRVKETYLIGYRHENHGCELDIAILEAEINMRQVLLHCLVV